MSCDLTYIVLCVQEILHNMGVCCIYLKDYDQVRQCLLHAINKFYCIKKLLHTFLSHSETIHRFFLARVCVCQAVERLSEAVSLSPQSQSYVQLGRVHLLRGDLQKATEVYKTAVE